jgi:hypothetical protein
MSRDSDKARIRKYLRLLENPYAFLQMGEISEVELATDAHASDRRDIASRLVRLPTQVDLFATQHKQAAAIIDTPHGNPYAALGDMDTDRPSVVAKHSSGQNPGAISQSAFEAGCRRIFAQYIPALERGRLRPEHLDFITRNRSSTAKIRFGLLVALRRYDLTDLPAMQPQFNREDDRLTAKKLLDIERSVAKDD